MHPFSPLLALATINKGLGMRLIAALIIAVICLVGVIVLVMTHNDEAAAIGFLTGAFGLSGGYLFGASDATSKSNESAAIAASLAAIASATSAEASAKIAANVVNNQQSGPGV
jgi:peptidoglycan/LPS O-acetylase OafA/YrhL